MKNESRPKIDWKRSTSSRAYVPSPFSSAWLTAPPRQPLVAIRPVRCCSSSSKSQRGFWKNPSRYACDDTLMRFL